MITGLFRDGQRRVLALLVNHPVSMFGREAVNDANTTPTPEAA